MKYILVVVVAVAMAVMAIKMFVMMVASVFRFKWDKAFNDRQLEKDFNKPLNIEECLRLYDGQVDLEK